MAKQYKWIHLKPLGRSNVICQSDGLLLPGSDPERNYIRQGELFQPTEAELQAFPDRIEEVVEEKGGKKK